MLLGGALGGGALLQSYLIKDFGDLFWRLFETSQIPNFCGKKQTHTIVPSQL
jgi:hypothetical protein